MSDSFLRTLRGIQVALENDRTLVVLLGLAGLLILLAGFLLIRNRRFLGYIFRNARRNPVRSALTISSIAISLFLMMILLAFLSVNSESATSLRDANRLVTLSSQGFAQPVPIALVNQVKSLDGIQAVSPMSWYGGNYMEEQMPFAQFGVFSDVIFNIYDEFTLPPEQLQAFQGDRAGCVIGRKLAEERNIKIGDPLPLKGTYYPFDLNLTVRGIYDGPSDRDLRICFFNWDYLDEGLKRDFPGKYTGNAGILIIKLKNSDAGPRISKAIDDMTRNSDTATRTQTEEAFVKIFLEMYGDLKGLIRNVGLAVVFSLVCVAGNAMAMALRERTTEVAVLRAIGFTPRLVVMLVLAEAILIAGIGGIVGALGSKALFASFDASKFAAGQLPFFYIPWSTALVGLGTALFIGLVSGIIPAVRAARLSVIDGLRKVV